MQITDHLMKCVQDMEAGEFEEALIGADSAIDEWPDVGLTHQLRGRILLALERLDEAAPALDEAIRLDPASSEAHLALGALHQATGDQVAAYDDFIRGLELAPNDPSVQLRVGYFLLREGQLDEADKLLLHAANGGAVVAVNGLVEIRETRGEYYEALDLLGSQPELLEQSQSLQVAEARLLLHLDRSVDALTVLERLAEEELTVEAAVACLRLMGDALHRLDRHDEADAACAQADKLTAGD